MGTPPLFTQPGPEGPGDTHPPVTHDNDDNHGNEEDQASRRGADDEWQLLLDACLVLGWGESTAQCSQLVPEVLPFPTTQALLGYPGSIPTPVRCSGGELAVTHSQVTLDKSMNCSNPQFLIYKMGTIPEFQC